MKTKEEIKTQDMAAEKSSSKAQKKEAAEAAAERKRLKLEKERKL